MARWREATWDPAGMDGGTYVDGYAWRGLLHTTEGRSYAGARKAYTDNNVWPHFTVTYEDGRFQAWQHIDTLRAARALRNPSGGVQTNRGRCVQIEIVGTCNTALASSWGTKYVEAFPRGYLDGIARLMRWIETIHGIRRSAVSRWKHYTGRGGADDSAGLDNGIRIPASDWPSFNGWCGHQHCPENIHGDPGLLDVAYLLGTTPGSELDMTADEVRKIVAEENAKLYRLIARGILPETGEVSPAHQRISTEGIRDALDDLDDL